MDCLVKSQDNLEISFKKVNSSIYSYGGKVPVFWYCISRGPISKCENIFSGLKHPILKFY